MFPVLFVYVNKECAKNSEQEFKAIDKKINKEKCRK